MTINETGLIDKGDIAWAALSGIERMLADKNLKLGEGDDQAIYDAAWDAAKHLSFTEA